MNCTPSRDSRCEPARFEDASALAALIMIAGEGLPGLVWEPMRGPDETLMDVGRRRAERDQGGFSYRNATVVREGGRIVSALVSYPISEVTPDAELRDCPAVFKPLAELENSLTPSWYINVLATFETHRRRGAAGMLLEYAEDAARASGADRLTLITGDRNPARSLYQRFGFRECSRSPVVKQGWENDSDFWIGYAKSVSGSRQSERVGI